MARTTNTPAEGATAPAAATTEPTPTPAAAPNVTAPAAVDPAPVAPADATAPTATADTAPQAEEAAPRVAYRGRVEDGVVRYGPNTYSIADGIRLGLVPAEAGDAQS